MIAEEARIPAEVSQFLERLTKLDRGERAILRRNVGSTIAEARSAMGVFYRILPPVRRYQEELYFLVATLYAFNDRPHQGDFGATLRSVKLAKGSDSMDRRMAALLDSDFDRVDGRYSGGGEIAFRLRQAVRLAASHQVGIHWGRMLDDLTWWSHPEKRVQKRWARSYFSGANSTDDQVVANEGGH